jgi:hypothetical protein
MAKLVKQIHDLVDIAFDKGLTNYWSRPQIDAAIFKGVTEMFRLLSREYPKTILSRSFMLSLQRSGTVTLTAGIGTLPTDFSHEVEVFVNDATKRHIPIIERGFWDSRRRDPIDVPTVSAPIGTIYSDSTGVKKLELYPLTASNPGILYFKVPTKSSYVTTIVLGQEVYDDTASVDVEFPPSLHDIITEKALSFLGLGLQDGMAVQLSQQSQSKEVKIP